MSRATELESPALQEVNKEIASLEAELAGYQDKVTALQRAKEARAWLSGERDAIASASAATGAPSRRRTRSATGSGTSLTDEQLERVLLTLRESGEPMKANELADTLGFDVKSAGLAPLVESGQVVKEGERRATTYRIA